MSTRCVTKFTCNGRSIDLYHHCDGYPEGIGFFLIKEMEKVKDEKEYTYQSPNNIVMKWVKDFDFEPTFYNHGDIEFYYEFDMDKKTVNGMAVDCWDGDMKIKQNYPLAEYYEKHKEDDVKLYVEE